MGPKRNRDAGTFSTHLTGSCSGKNCDGGPFHNAYLVLSALLILSQLILTAMLKRLK